MSQFDGQWLTLLGTLGIGLVWGWLIGMWGSSLRRVIHGTNLIGAGSAMIGAIIFLITNLEYVIAFVVSTILALVIHLIWRRILARRYPTSTLQGGKT